MVSCYFNSFMLVWFKSLPQENHFLNTHSVLELMTSCSYSLDSTDSLSTSTLQDIVQHSSPNLPKSLRIISGCKETLRLISSSSDNFATSSFQIFCLSCPFDFSAQIHLTYFKTPNINESTCPQFL